MGPQESIIQFNQVFFRKVGNTGLVIAAHSAALLTSQVALPLFITTTAGYLAVAGGILTAVNQARFPEGSLVGINSIVTVQKSPIYQQPTFLIGSSVGIWFNFDWKDLLSTIILCACSTATSSVITMYLEKWRNKNLLKSESQSYLIGLPGNWGAFWDASKTKFNFQKCLELKDLKSERTIIED